MNAKTMPTRHAVILCHPDHDSFIASVADRYCQAVQNLGHEAIVRDLYRLGFDPVLKSSEKPHSGDGLPCADVAVEIAEIRNADVFVLVYPIWFGTPPAMLKGYVERVFGAGFDHHAIRDQKRHSFLTDKHLVSLSSSGNSIQWLEEQGAWLSLRNVFDHYFAKAFSMASDEHIHFSNIVGDMSAHNVDVELFRVTEFAHKICAGLLKTGCD
jgi:NAD(P)H dehydrogenase (quinone)